MSCYMSCHVKFYVTSHVISSYISCHISCHLTFCHLSCHMPCDMWCLPSKNIFPPRKGIFWSLLSPPQITAVCGSYYAWFGETLWLVGSDILILVFIVLLCSQAGLAALGLSNGEWWIWKLKRFFYQFVDISSIFYQYPGKQYFHYLNELNFRNTSI